MRSQALEDLFLDELQELYDAEKQIYKGLSLMAKTATSRELTSAFDNHQKQTKLHVQRLEKCFKMLGERPSRGEASGVSGQIRQNKLLASGSFDPAVVDAALIAGAQKIEHYEIASYGCVRTHAGILGYKEIEDLLGETLKEEEETDALLTQIAQGTVNRVAAAAPYAQARTGPRHIGSELLSETPASDGKLSLGKIALGLAIGGAISVLFAPDSGDATRARVKGFLQNAGDKIKGATEAI